MDASSRTAKSLKNGIVAIGFYFINLILQFFSRKIFLEYLGTEILGLNSTSQNLLQFLNIAELGIGTAVSFTLFKPLSEKDTKTINEIVNLQGQLYKRIGLFVLCGASVLMLFFPIIFEKITIPIWYAYASFCVLLLSSLLSYFVNYRQIILTANQEDYKIQYCYKPIQFVKLVFQIIAVKYCGHGYVWWLSLEAIGAISSAYLLRCITYKNAPYLCKIKRSFKSLAQQYHSFTVKIKQLFIHKISLFALSETAPLIIYAYLDLTIVAYYVNYQLIFTGVKQFLNAGFNSIGAGVGNLVSTASREQILRVFDELFTVRFVCAIIIGFCIYNMTGPFIELWIGREYLLPKTSVILMIVTLFIGIVRGAVEAFIYAYGLYGDVWAAGAEAVLNLGGSIILGYYFGLNGILCGVLISLIVIILGWKPYYLFHSRLKGYFKVYHFKYLKHIAIAAPTCLLSQYLFSFMQCNWSANWMVLTIGTAICFLIISVISLILYYALTSGFRNFIKRFI